MNTVNRDPSSPLASELQQIALSLLSPEPGINRTELEVRHTKLAQEPNYLSALVEMVEAPNQVVQVVDFALIQLTKQVEPASTLTAEPRKFLLFRTLGLLREGRLGERQEKILSVVLKGLLHQGLKKGTSNPLGETRKAFMEFMKEQFHDGNQNAFYQKGCLKTIMMGLKGFLGGYLDYQLTVGIGVIVDVLSKIFERAIEPVIGQLESLAVSSLELAPQIQAEISQELGIVGLFGACLTRLLKTIIKMESTRTRQLAVLTAFHKAAYLLTTTQIARLNQTPANLLFQPTQLPPIDEKLAQIHNNGFKCMRLLLKMALKINKDPEFFVLKDSSFLTYLKLTVKWALGSFQDRFSVAKGRFVFLPKSAKPSRTIVKLIFRVLTEPACSDFAWELKEDLLLWLVLPVMALTEEELHSADDNPDEFVNLSADLLGECRSKNLRTASVLLLRKLLANVTGAVSYFLKLVEGVCELAVAKISSGSGETLGPELTASYFSSAGPLELLSWGLLLPALTQAELCKRPDAQESVRKIVFKFSDLFFNTKLQPVVVCRFMSLVAVHIKSLFPIKAKNPDPRTFESSLRGYLAFATWLLNQMNDSGITVRMAMRCLLQLLRLDPYGDLLITHSAGPFLDAVILVIPISANPDPINAARRLVVENKKPLQGLEEKLLAICQLCLQKLLDFSASPVPASRHFMNVSLDMIKALAGKEEFLTSSFAAFDQLLSAAFLSPQLDLLYCIHEFSQIYETMARKARSLGSQRKAVLQRIMELVIGSPGYLADCFTFLNSFLLLHPTEFGWEHIDPLLALAKNLGPSRSNMPEVTQTKLHVLYLVGLLVQTIGGQFSEAQIEALKSVLMALLTAHSVMPDEEVLEIADQIVNLYLCMVIFLPPGSLQELERPDFVGKMMELASKNLTAFRTDYDRKLLTVGGIRILQNLIALGWEASQKAVLQLLSWLGPFLRFLELRVTIKLLNDLNRNFNDYENGLLTDYNDLCQQLDLTSHQDEFGYADELDPNDDDAFEEDEWFACKLKKEVVEKITSPISDVDQYAGIRSVFQAHQGILEHLQRLSPPPVWLHHLREVLFRIEIVTLHKSDPPAKAIRHILRINMSQI